MKKIILSIPEPCHQDWNQMTSVEKGRFCSSCKKTVIDFSMMSDREIAAFLKKPASSTCGRFRKDQLDRELLIPKKRIPWLRYFFQITWPAMVLFLKSCGSRNQVTGDYTIDKKEIIEYNSVEVNGVMVRDITNKNISIKAENNLKKHKIKPVRKIEHDHLVKTEAKLITNEFPTEKMPKFDEMARFDEMQMSQVITVGGFIRVSRVDLKIQESDQVEQKNHPIADEQDLQVYPNPVKAGQSITIARNNGNFYPGQVQLLSSSGQLVHRFQFSSTQQSSFQISLPSSLKPGLYFLQMTEPGTQSSFTKKLIVQ